MAAPQDVLRRIRHAEEWLRWARSDCLRGDLRGMVLRLMLAEAEIRHVRETGIREAVRAGAWVRSAHRRMALVGAAVGLAAVTVALSAVYVGVRRQGGGQAAVESPAGAFRGPAPLGPSAVRLDTGGFLTLVQTAGGAGQEGAPSDLARMTASDLLGSDAEGPGAAVTPVDALPVRGPEAVGGRTPVGPPKRGALAGPARPRALPLATPRF